MCRWDAGARPNYVRPVRAYVRSGRTSHFSPGGRRGLSKSVRVGVSSCTLVVFAGYTYPDVS